MRSTNETLGQRIRKRRIALGMNQGELAKLLGVQQAAVSRLENDGIKHPGNLMEIAKALKTNQGYLSGILDERVADATDEQIEVFQKFLRLSSHDQRGVTAFIDASIESGDDS